MLDQPGGDVVAGFAALEGDQLHEAGGEFVAGAQRVLAVEHVGHRARDAVADGGGAAEELVDHQQRQQLGVVVDQVRPAPLAELVDEVGGDRFDVPADAGDVEPVEALGDRLAQPEVLGPVGEQAVGPVRHHRQDGAVERDAAVVEGGPAAAVAREQGGVLEHPQGRLVSDDQGGVDAGGQFHRAYRSVRPEVVVDLLGVRGEGAVVHGASGRTGGGRVVNVHVCVLWWPGPCGPGGVVVQAARSRR